MKLDEDLFYWINLAKEEDDSLIKYFMGGFMDICLLPFKSIGLLIKWMVK